jgi:hypothetical protein
MENEIKELREAGYSHAGIISRQTSLQFLNKIRFELGEKFDFAVEFEVEKDIIRLSKRIDEIDYIIEHIKNYDTTK